ncbi:RNA polymerase sigma factor [Flagellimonas flava]|uniref:RNA polymerase sigma-70 factor, ECF subfamily n=1 Tax=Flagellimonas flava TaxID=570519 RepID=A0A1M5N5E0_9FLAO|nr:RNA polymerase sigma factor [Allomuricauda flava]SHG84768.1 RNA polymerase sigma-70 factor, ECF subfamily [Allomuricauda flava]
MKIVALYTNEKQLIKKAIAGEQQSQKQLYNKFAPKMLGICRQYIKDVHFAEDVMVDGFVKVFKNLNSFEHRGSFEGWVRRIMVRECISFLRKKQFVVYDEETYLSKPAQDEGMTSAFDVEYVQQLIDELPEGYKMVFLLYAIEGYKHHEIAKMLKISEGTSKSQLFKARKMLQENLKLSGLSPNKRSKGK